MKKVTRYYKTKDQKIQELEERIIKLEDESEIRHLKEQHSNFELKIQGLQDELKKKDEEIKSLNIKLKEQVNEAERKLNFEKARLSSVCNIQSKDNIEMKKEIKRLEIKNENLKEENKKIVSDYEIIRELYIDKIPEYISSQLSKTNNIKSDERFGYRESENKWYFPDYESKDESIKNMVRNQIENNKIGKIEEVLYTYFEDNIDSKMTLYDIRMMMNYFFELDNISPLNKSGKDIDLLSEQLSKYECKRTNKGLVVKGLKFKHSYEILKVKDIEAKRYAN